MLEETAVTTDKGLLTAVCRLESDAAFIVRAVNSHDALVDSVTELQGLWFAMAVNGASPDAAAWIKINIALDRSMAALAKAKGE